MLIGGRHGTHAHTYSYDQGSSIPVHGLNAASSSSREDALPAPVTGNQTVLSPRDEDAHTVSHMFAFSSTLFHAAWVRAVASAELIAAYCCRYDSTERRLSLETHR